MARGDGCQEPVKDQGADFAFLAAGRLRVRFIAGGSGRTGQQLGQFLGEGRVTGEPGVKPVAKSLERLAAIPAVSADLAKALGQDMLQEAPGELLAVHGGLQLLLPGGVAVGEGDGFFVHGQDAIRADPDAVRVARKIADDLHRSGKRLFGVDTPALRGGHVELVPEVGFGVFAGESQFAAVVKALQGLQELAPEDLADRAHREEKLMVVRALGHDPLALGVHPAIGHDPVNMRMVLQQLPPGVKYPDKSAPRADMLRIGEKVLQGLRADAEKQIVAPRFIVAEDRVQLLRNGEDHMEVMDRQQLGHLLFDPGACPVALANRTVPVAAGMIALLFMAALAVVTAVLFPAHGGCATKQDRVHRFPLFR